MGEELGNWGDKLAGDLYRTVVAFLCSLSIEGG